MQFDRAADGTLTPLPFQSVDTGHGPRAHGVRRSRGWTATTGPICSRRSSTAWPRTSATTRRTSRRALQLPGRRRPLAGDDLPDRPRACTPSNEGPGYVLRRIMRRAVRHVRLMGIYGAGAGRDLRGGHRPHGRARTRTWPSGATRSWPRSRPRRSKFARTLEAGTERLAALVARRAATISGDEAFRLHDTFGFPIDLTIEIAAERGVTVDRAGFDAAMAEQRERSRGERRGSSRGSDGLAGLTQRVHRLSERDRGRRPARPGRRPGRGRIARCVLDRTPVLRGGRRPDRRPRRAGRRARHG